MVAGPWYLTHLEEIRTSGDLVGEAARAGGRSPSRLSGENVSWYAWAFTNHVLLLPLSLFAAAGVVVAAVRYGRTRAKDSLAPELLGGLVAGWVLMTIFISFRDNRYMLPALVYAAVLGTAWIVTLPAPWRILATAGLAGVAAMNFAAVSFGLQGHVTLALPGFSTDVADHGRVALYSSSGWLTSGPEKGGDVPGIIERQLDGGVRAIGFETGGTLWFNNQGLAALAAMRAIPTTTDPRALKADGLFVFTRRPVGPFARPCVRAVDGTPIFFARGGQPGPLEAWKLVCPRA